MFRVAASNRAHLTRTRKKTFILRVHTSTKYKKQVMKMYVGFGWSIFLFSLVLVFNFLYLLLFGCFYFEETSDHCE